MTNIAVLISGQLRQFPKTVSVINSFLDWLKSQQSNIDVFVCSDNHHDSLKTLKYLKDSFFISDIEEKEHLHFQISRLAICYNLIKNHDKYDWFIKLRPDYTLDVSTFPEIKYWDKSKINCKFRLTNNRNIRDKLYFSWSGNCYWNNPNIPDDQLFIIPKSIHKKAFLLNFGNHPIPKIHDNRFGLFPELKQGNLWYSYNISLNPIAFKGNLFRFEKKQEIVKKLKT